MTTPTLIYIENTNVLELRGVKSAIEGTFINDAVVTITLEDSAGQNVTGQTWPATMTHIANSDGNYRGVLSDELVLKNNRHYTAVINADGGPDRKLNIRMPVKAEIRKS